MKPERFEILAGVLALVAPINATKLQRIIFLLEEVGIPLDYDFQLFFYGPWSEGLYAELGLLKHIGFAKLRGAYWIATEHCKPELVEPWRAAIEYLNDLNPKKLEDAAGRLRAQKFGKDIKNPVLNELKELVIE